MKIGIVETIVGVFALATLYTVLDPREPEDPGSPPIYDVKDSCIAAALHTNSAKSKAAHSQISVIREGKKPSKNCARYYAISKGETPKQCVSINGLFDADLNDSWTTTFVSRPFHIATVTNLPNSEGALLTLTPFYSRLSPESYMVDGHPRYIEDNPARNISLQRVYEYRRDIGKFQCISWDAKSPVASHLNNALGLK